MDPTTQAEYQDLLLALQRAGDNYAARSAYYRMRSLIRRYTMRPIPGAAHRTWLSRLEEVKQLWRQWQNREEGNGQHDTAHVP
ncbi:hypothetical protein VNI00_018770 [Paramarasmius palmivorus]|uniref:Uncharacterized protein n=1 Tax=Paramarasmius palmivorus TaxID=297713 RepID=A0AAW0AWA5_9AGAR